MARRLTAVYGVRIPRPRVTYEAVAVATLVGAPVILAIGATLDALVWIAAREMFGVCVGLWCGS